MYQGLDLDNYWDGYVDPAESSSGSGRSGLTGSTPGDLQLALQNQDYDDAGLFTPSYNSGGSYLDTGQGFGVLGLFTPPFRREVAIYDTVHETQCHMDHSGIHVGVQTTQRRHCSLHGTSYRTSGVHMSVGNGGIGIRSFATSGGGSARRRRGIFGQSNDYPDTGYSDDPFHAGENYYGATSTESDEQQGPIITEVDDSDEDESFESNRAIEYKQQSSLTETLSRQNSETEVGETKDTKRRNKNEAMSRSFTRLKNKNALPERKRSNSNTLLQSDNDKTDTRSVTEATMTPTFHLIEDDTIHGTKASPENRSNKDTLNDKAINKSTSQLSCAQQDDIVILGLGETLDLSVVQQSEDQDYDNNRHLDNNSVEESLTKADSYPTDTDMDYRSCIGGQDNKLNDASEDKNTNYSALNVKPFEVGNNGNNMTKQELCNSGDSVFPTSNVKPELGTVIADVRPQNKNSLPQRKASTCESTLELEYDTRNNKNANESSNPKSKVEVTLPTNRPIEDNIEQPPLTNNEQSQHIGDNVLHEFKSDGENVNVETLSESTSQFSYTEKNDRENIEKELIVLNEFQTCDISEYKQTESQDAENDTEPVMKVENEDPDGHTNAAEPSHNFSKTQNTMMRQEIGNCVSSDIPYSDEKHDPLTVDVGIIQNKPVSNIHINLRDDEDFNIAPKIGTAPVSSELPKTFPLSDSASKTMYRASRTLGFSKTNILSIDGSEGVHHSNDQNNSDVAITCSAERDGNQRNIDSFITGDTDDKDKTDKTIPEEKSFSVNKKEGLEITYSSNAFDQSVEPASNYDSGDEDEFKSLVTNDTRSTSKTSIESKRTSFTYNNYTHDDNARYKLYLAAEANNPHNEMIDNSFSIQNANISLNFSNSFKGYTSYLYRQRKTVKEEDNRYAYQDDLTTKSSLRNERPINLRLIQNLRRNTQSADGNETELKSEILKSTNERLERANGRQYVNNFDNGYVDRLAYKQDEIQPVRHNQTKYTFQSTTSYSYDLNDDGNGKKFDGTTHNAAESTKAASSNHQVNWTTNKDPSPKTSGTSTDKIRRVFNSAQRTDYMEPSSDRVDKPQQNDTNQTTPENNTYSTDTNANKRDVYMNSDYVKDFKREYPSSGTASTHEGNERSFQHASTFYNTSQYNRKPDDHSKRTITGEEKSQHVHCRHICPHIQQPPCEHCKTYGMLHIHTHCGADDSHVVCGFCDGTLVGEKYSKLMQVVKHGKGDDPLDHPEWRDIKDTLNWNVDPPKPAKKNKNKLPDKEARIDPQNTSELSDIDNRQDYKRSDSYPKYNRSNSGMSEKVVKAGLVLKDVHPDGNCLFAAVVDQLRVRGEFFYTARTLRRAAVTYLREHPRQDDGTELVSYLTDFDGSWDQYLRRMSREGEWGDHLVISAIANILQRRLVIMNNTSDKPTIQIPERPKHSLRTQANRSPEKDSTPENTDDESNKRPVMENVNSLKVDGESKDETKYDPDTDNETQHSDLDNKEKVTSSVKILETDNLAMDGPTDEFEYDDLHLGHISEAHYVSLRHHDWENRLHEVLRRKTTSCFLYYGNNTPQAETSRNTSFEDKDSKDDLHKQDTSPHSADCLSFPKSHTSFLMQFLRRLEILPRMNAQRSMNQRTITKFGSCVCISDLLNGLECYIPRYEEHYSKRNKVSLSRSGTSVNREAKIVMLPNDTKILQGNGKHCNTKDIVAVSNDDSVFSLKLKPVSPEMWKPYAETIAGETYLAHLVDKRFDRNSTLLGFKCEWPAIAEEWISRERKADWPQEDLKSKVIAEGAIVLPECRAITSSPGLDWKYSFCVAEQILCRTGINVAAKFCFKLFKMISSFIFQQKECITDEHLKVVFYDTCEHFVREQFVEESGECLDYMFSTLERCLAQHILPDYFTIQKNLVEHTDSRELDWHADTLRAFQRHFIEHIYLLFMNYGWTNFESVEICLESLIEDAQRVVLDGQSSEESYSMCFNQLNMVLIQERVKKGEYYRAKRLSEVANQELLKHSVQNTCDIESFYQGVLKGLTMFHQWLFAFYLDFESTGNLMNYVCSNEECVVLESVFGDQLVQQLVAIKRHLNGNLWIPVRLAHQGNLTELATHFFKVLDELDEDAYFIATRYFLKENTKELLTNITKERNEGISYSEHNVTITNLEKIFKDLYTAYYEMQQGYQFQDMMEHFDMLCNYSDTTHTYTYLAELWDRFGEKDKAAEASIKAVALGQTHSGNYASTAV